MAPMAEWAPMEDGVVVGDGALAVAGTTVPIPWLPRSVAQLVEEAERVRPVAAH